MVMGRATEARCEEEEEEETKCSRQTKNICVYVYLSYYVVCLGYRRQWIWRLVFIILDLLFPVRFFSVSGCVHWFLFHFSPAFFVCMRFIVPVIAHVIVYSCVHSRTKATWLYQLSNQWTWQPTPRRNVSWWVCPVAIVVFLPTDE